MANKIRPSDVAVTFLARWLTRMLPLIIIAIFLVLCVAIYAMAWSFRR